MNDEERNKLLQDINERVNFILNKLGYNPFTFSPHGNGFLGRLEKAEKRLEALSPTKIIKAAAGLLSSLAVLGGALLWLLKHFGG